MSTPLESITPELETWLASQHIFFVATAPLAGDGHVNLSPKGLSTLRVLGDNDVAYLDCTGSGSETRAHLQASDDKRLTLMFCAFTGRPDIVRLHGRGRFVTADDPAAADLLARFPDLPGARAVIVVDDRTCMVRFALRTALRKRSFSKFDVTSRPRTPVFGTYGSVPSGADSRSISSSMRIAAW